MLATIRREVAARVIVVDFIDLTNASVTEELGLELAELVRALGVVQLLAIVFLIIMGQVILGVIIRIAIVYSGTDLIKHLLPVKQILLLLSLLLSPWVEQLHCFLRLAVFARQLSLLR